MEEPVAPIVIFCFNRPAHTRNMLASLAANPEFADSDTYIFCDGARGERDVANVEKTIAVAREFIADPARVIVSGTNKGLKRSIIDGLDYVFQTHSTAIVLEDDLTFSPQFLGFMNRALDEYADQPKVAQVSGYSFLAREDDACVFLPTINSWGWATWKDAWFENHPAKADTEKAARLLKKRQARKQFDFASAYPFSKILHDQLYVKNTSWAIWFYFNVFTHNLVTVYPPRSLVNNEGFDGTGTNCRNASNIRFKFRNESFVYPSTVKFDPKVLKTVKHAMIRERGPLRYVNDTLWRNFRGFH
ncbi:MAG: hypothetical protein COA41_12220 [Sphingopyxis sp.]|nr:MAG: hypothetical protein COA41_12220 [Sphingopyxis sp.]